MACADIPEWFLRNRIPVINLRSSAWRRARESILSARYPAAVCLKRLEQAKLVRRVRRGLYVVVDPVRETPKIALASATFADERHYVTTDAALAFHALIDQPVPVITVVVVKMKRSFSLDHTIVHPVQVTVAALERADSYRTSLEGFRVDIASREQAVADALAEPRWMTHFSLLPGILTSLDTRSLAVLADKALERRGSAAQRLGYLLDEARLKVPAKLQRFQPISSHVQLVPGQPTNDYSKRWGVHA